MRLQLGGFTLETGRSAEQALALTKASGMDLVTSIPATDAGWWPVIRESFAGAWQRNVAATVADAVTHPTFWACITLIAGDIAKLRPMLMLETPDGRSAEVSSAAFSPVLIKPNHYQDRIQFIAYWVLSKLTRGNTYVLKERDARNVVVALYVLDPTRCRPLLAPNGDVYYALGQDLLSGVGEDSVVVPAREIIHDRHNCVYHPLCGLSSIFAGGHVALTGQKIMRNMQTVADNGSMIGGILVAPGEISQANVDRLEKHWNANYVGGANAGKVAVIGNGMRFEKPSVMSGVDLQIIEHLKWGDEKTCAVNHVPGWKVGVGPMPATPNPEALETLYWSQCLQVLVESLELCLTEGLATYPYEVELDVAALSRMDSVQKMDTAVKAIGGGIYTINEARARFGLKPVDGGDTPFLQEQNWPVDMLADRELPAKAPTAPAPAPAAAAPPPEAAKDLGARARALLAKAMEAAA